MRYKLHLILVFSVFSKTGVSQSNDNSWDTGKLVDQIEIHAGPSLLYPKPAYDFHNDDRLIKIGYSIGLDATFGVGRKFGIESNLSYERNGIKNSNNLPNDVTVTVDVSNDYVRLSVLPQLVFGPADRFTFGVGPYVAYLVSSKTRLTYDSINGTHSSFHDHTSDYYSQFDYGLVLSGKYSFFVRGRVFILRLININGMINVDKTPIPSLISIHKNNSLALIIGIRI